MYDTGAEKRQFWLLWVLASAIGGAAVALIARSAAYATGYGATEAGVSPVLSEAALGFVALGGFMGAIGVAQWLVLGRQVRWGGRWAGASALGGGLGGSVMLALFIALPGATLAPVAGVISGLVVLGLVHWTILRGVLPHARWLAVASVLGIIAAPLLAGVVGALGVPEVGTGAAFGIGSGAMTGASLIYFGALQSGRPTEPLAAD